jgi:phosphotransferase system enzyme I (PtsI)
MFAEAAKSLEKENVPYNPNIRIGVMVEIPSVAVAADLFAPEIDFFSIGTNDLIQFTLAIDRTNKYVTHLYRPLHPAVLRMLKFIGQTARDNDVKVFMCGEMASDPLNIPILLGLGIDELSMNPQSIPIVKKVIQYISIEESRDFVTHILKLKTADEITKEVEKTYGPIISDLVYSSNNHYIQ